MHNDSGNYNFNLHRSVILLILPFDAANEPFKPHCYYFLRLKGSPE